MNIGTFIKENKPNEVKKIMDHSSYKRSSGAIKQVR